MRETLCIGRRGRWRVVSLRCVRAMERAVRRWVQPKQLAGVDCIPAVLGSCGTESLFECAISRIYAYSAVSALSLEQALACKTGRSLLARSLWAGFRQPRRRSFFGQVIGIPHSNRLSAAIAVAVS